MRRYGQVVVTVASMTAATYRMRYTKPSSSMSNLSVGTVKLAYSQAYLMACSTACKGILKSRADIIKSELDEAASDVHATWRMAQRLLHSRHKVVYDDAQCAQLVLAFSQFFVDKVRCTRDNISAALQSSVHRTFAIR